MWGMVQSMLRNSLANLTGHIQVHHPDFLQDPALDNRMDSVETLREALEAALPEGSRTAWRVRIETVAANARHNGGFTLVATDLETAREMTFLGQAVIEGSLPGEGSPPNRILVGKALLEDFETAIGNKLILTNRAADGEIRSRAFHISGSFDTPLESNETAFAFVRLEDARDFLGIDKAITELSVMLPDIASTEAVARDLSGRLDPERFQVSTWRERAPMVTAYIEIWRFFSWIWGLVVFIAMAFGLVNTLLMAVYERIREFGLMRALGMSGGRILSGILLESCLLLLVGLAIGNSLAFAAVAWIGTTGIDLAAFSSSSEMLGLSRMVYPAVRFQDVLLFNSMVFFLGLVVSLYPAWRAARFTPVEAMKHFK
jgi:ABC-type lipoprotein release transport system permease subunit